MMQTGDNAGSVPAFRLALPLRPDLVEAAINPGPARKATGQADAARAVWRAALPAAPPRHILHNQLGRLMAVRGTLGAAAGELRTPMLIDSGQPDVQQHLIHLRQRMTAWLVADLAIPGLETAVATRHAGPLAALALSADLAEPAATGVDRIARKASPVSGRLSA